MLIIQENSSLKFWDVQSGPDYSVIARSDCGRGDGLCNTVGFCEKKTACYIWTDHLPCCFETQQSVWLLSLYHGVQQKTKGNKEIQYYQVFCLWKLKLTTSYHTGTTCNALLVGDTNCCTQDNQDRFFCHDVTWFSLAVPLKLKWLSLKVCSTNQCAGCISLNEVVRGGHSAKHCNKLRPFHDT